MVGCLSARPLMSCRAPCGYFDGSERCLLGDSCTSCSLYLQAVLQCSQPRFLSISYVSECSRSASEAS